MNTEKTATLIRQNLRDVEARIRSAAERRRQRHDVKLVVVTKSVHPEILPVLRGLGITDIGESTVQDALKKANAGNFTWHMVGHLQRNKARHAVGFFSLIHSLDSLALAEALQKQAVKRDCSVDVLIQANLSGERQKHGLPRQAVLPLLKELAGLERVRAKGLMTMAPFTNDPETCRVFFRGLRELRDEIASVGLEHVDMRELSMGMTQDFEVAVEEGATLVRIGSAVFRGL